LNTSGIEVGCRNRVRQRDAAHRSVAPASVSVRVDDLEHAVLAEVGVDRAWLAGAYLHPDAARVRGGDLHLEVLRVRAGQRLAHKLPDGEHLLE